MTGVFSFQDPAIVESSGLVALATGLDDQRLGRHRPGVHRRRHHGETVGVTTWADDPVDVEALAPAGPGEVWVGDIGDNAGRAGLDLGSPGCRSGTGTGRSTA